MSRYNYVRWIFWLGLLGLVVGAGCTVKNKGTPHANTPPKVFFSTVPVAGTVFTKPDQFFWFALDRDGYIVEFQYALVPESLVKITQNPPQKEDSVVRAFLTAHPVDADTIWRWKVVDNIRRNGQTDTIALPTSSQSAADTTTRNTVVFVRARDDRGALSTSSRFFPDSNSIAWRYFGRKNRPPRTHFASISVCNKSPVTVAGQIPTFYSIDQATYDTSAFIKVGHCGITIAWFGSDSADYPNQEQPPFDYFWELFGPFSSSNPNVIGPDTNKLWASSTYPVRWPGPNAAPYQSPNARSFTKAMSATFFGLRGFDTLTNFRPGFYYFRVRTRDDAGVLAPLNGNPPPTATHIFKVIHPRFDRDILLVGKSTTWGGGAFLNLVSPYGFIPDGSTPPQDSAQIQNYYLKLIRDAGYGGHIDSAQDVKFYSEKSDAGFTLMPLNDSVLARYKLVIFHKEGVYPTQNTNLTAMLKAYMDVGGSVWGMGREDLTDLLPNIAGVDRPLEVFYDHTNPINGVGYFYFGAEKMFYNAHARSVAADSISREEFVGAGPTDIGVGAGLPPLDIDTDVVMRYTVAAARRDTSRYREMPGVNYFVRQTRSDPLYLYRSPVGVADTSHLNGKVVALRANRTFFKTAYFGFPLYGIKESQAVLVMQNMLNWFIGAP